MKTTLIVAMVFAVCVAKPPDARCEWQGFRYSDSHLAGAWILSALEDRSGNLWFGALGGGVSKFDGVSWRTYLVGHEVRAMREDQSGNLWFCTSDGLNRFDGVSWTTYTVADGLAGMSISSMLVDRSGNLWFGTNDGVSRYDGVSWKSYRYADGLAGHIVYSMLEDRSGSLWFGTDFGLSRFDGVSWRTWLAGITVLSMLEDRSGNLWFGTDGGGARRYDGATWQAITTVDGLANNFVFSMLEDRWGTLWFGTHGGGASRYDGRTWRTFTTDDGLTSNSVNSMLEDRSGNLWFATSDGVSRFDRADWRTYTTTAGLVDNGVISMIEDRSRNLWFGTNYGASRFDGVNWKIYTTDDGLVENDVVSMLEDRSGNFWFGTSHGASRFDGLSWRTYTVADGLGGDYILSILEDHSGNIWLGTNNGASRFDGVSWRTYTTADGLAGVNVRSMLEDRSGNLWFGTGGGVSRFDGVSWRSYTTADGLAGGNVSSMLEDRSGNLWFGAGGVSRFDGASWRTYTTADGLAGNYVQTMLEDRLGNIWIVADYVVNLFDGVSWRTYGKAEGLTGSAVTSMLQDGSGNIWFGTDTGVSRYEPDRVPPKTLFISTPATLSGSRNLSATFIAAYGEANGVEFSYKFDGGPWSAWAPVGAWAGGGLADGAHVLEARSRDFALNVDHFPALAAFLVDATPPSPLISSPAFGQAVRGTVEIRGTTADARFTADSVWVRPAGAGSWEPPGATLLVHSTIQVADGVLANWSTSALPDGNYDLRLSVTDSLGLAGTALVAVVVDNHAPFFDETAPTNVPAATGGDVYTTNAETHLYFPPHAFAQDAVVVVTAAAAGSVPGTLPGGVTKVADGYEMDWAGSLQKSARFTMSYAGASIAAGTLALYRSPDGTHWERLGGTVDPSTKSISLAVSAPGRYALFADNGAGAGTATLSPIAFTPRVFSPSGAFADKEVGISFSLGKAAPVTVRVYSRSGRLIREVAEGLQLNAGANLLHWDGRDGNGGYAVDGLYLVTVEALGHTETKNLAVVK